MNFLIIEHLDIEPVALIGEVIKGAGHQYSTVSLQQGDSLPANAEAFDGIVVMGGPQSANDLDHVMQSELLWIKAAIDANVAMLGICLGAQIMAKATGANILPSPVRELGWYPVFHNNDTHEDPLFKEIPDNFTVFQWHGETSSISSAMTLVLTHADVPAQAFRLGKAQYGLQFHVEVDEKIIEKWIEYGESERHHLAQHGLAQLHQDTEAYLKPMRHFCRQMVTSWLSVI